MWFPERIRHVASVNIEPALNALDKLDESVWFADEKTKQYLAGDRPTQSLFFFSMTKEEYVATLAKRAIEQSDVKELQAHDLLYDDFAYLFDAIQDYYPRGGIFLRAQIARMPPGGVIKEHRDSLIILENTHRLHIPLVTTSKLKFIVDNERVTLEEGQIYELNNQLSHSVKNPVNSINRIHLILDYLPPEYNVPESTDENFKFFIREHRAGRVSRPSKLNVDPPRVVAAVAHPNSISGYDYALHELDFKKRSVRKVFDFAELDAEGAAFDQAAELVGLVVDKKGVIIAAGNALFFLNSSYKLRESAPTPLLSHASALACEGNFVYVVSRGTDSVIRFDRRNKVYDTLWQFYVDDAGKIAVRKTKADARSSLEPSNLFELNNVSFNNGNLLVAGKNLTGLIKVGDSAAESGAQIPRSTSSVIGFNKGIAFLNPDMKRVAYMSDYDFRAVNSESLISQGSSAMNFSRGLCRYQNGTLLAGTQPAGVALLDMKNLDVIMEIDIDKNEHSTVMDIALIS